MSEPTEADRSEAPGLSPRRQAAVGLVLLLFFEGLLLYQYGWRHQNLLHADLPPLYFATHMAFRHHQSPYDFPAMAEQAPIIEQPVFPFLYPPPSLVPLLPLAMVSYRAAKWGMVLANHLLVPLLAYLLGFRVTRFANPVLGFFAAAAVLLSFPITQTIVHDQINVAVIVLICWSWLGLRRERAGWPGVPLALAVLLKQSPVILLALLVVERRWRALGTAVATLGAALIVSVVAVPGRAWSDWFEVVRPSLFYGRMPVFLFSPACPYNQSLNGAVSRLFLDPSCTPTDSVVPIAGRVLAYGLALAIVGLSLAATWWTSRLPSAIRIDRGFALLLPAMFLVSPLAWEHHLVFVLPSLVVACTLVLNRRRPSAVWACLLAVCALVIALPLPIDHPALRYGLWVHLISLRTYAVLGLWAILLVLSPGSTAIPRRPKPETASHVPRSPHPTTASPASAVRGPSVFFRDRPPC